MTALEQIHKVYQDAQKNNFWDAWGIVASPITIHELTADVRSRMILHYKDDGDVTTIFGLVVIPCEICERDKAYVVDEQLGRTILGEQGWTM